MPSNPPRQASNAATSTTMTTETFQKHYGRGAAFSGNNGQPPPSRLSPHLHPYPAPPHYPPSGPRHHGHPSHPHAPHPHDQRGHPHHLPPGPPGYGAPPSPWHYHYGGASHPHTLPHAVPHHSQPKPGARPHSPYSSVPHPQTGPPQSVPGQGSRAKSPQNDEVEKSNVSTKTIDSLNKTNNGHPNDVNDGTIAAESNDVVSKETEKISNSNAKDLSKTESSGSGAKATSKSKHESPPTGKKTPTNDIANSTGKDNTLSKDSNDNTKTAMEKESNPTLPMDDEDELQVEPMKQDFHFFAMDNFKAMQEECRKQMENEQIELKDKDGNKENNQLFIQTTLLNSRLLSKWESAGSNTRSLYMRREEADRKRFMDEEEVASRHCETLTARRRAPKTSVAPILSVGAMDGNADLSAKRSHEGGNEVGAAENSMKRNKVE